LALLSHVIPPDLFTFLSRIFNTIEVMSRAENCPTCGLGAGGSEPIILDEVRFLLNELLTASQTCFVCEMLYGGISLLPNFQDVLEIEINKREGALTPLEVTLRGLGQKVGTTYEFYIPSGISYPPLIVDFYYNL
jgi:hypothetical protein